MKLWALMMVFGTNALAFGPGCARFVVLEPGRDYCTEKGTSIACAGFPVTEGVAVIVSI